MDLKLPELGEGVHEGELISWKVKVGDTVKDDQPICEIMTDKATVELPSPFHGKVTALNAKEGEVVHVNQVILTYEGAAASATKGAGAPAASAAAPAPAAAKAPASSAASSVATVASRGGSASAAPEPSGEGLRSSAMSAAPAHVLAAPSTRRYAREQGVELATVSGSGPHGRVMRDDVEAFISGNSRGGSKPAQAKSSGAGATAAGTPAYVARTTSGTGGEERIAFKGLRKKIAEKMHQSKSTAAHFTYVEECDATALVQLRNQAKEIGAKQGIKVTYLPFIMKAMVAAIKKFPIMNSTLDEAAQQLVIKHFYNIGLSVQTDDGLTVPVVKNVEQKSVLQIAHEIQILVDKARTKKLTMDDLKGSTITLTNAGSIGGLFATPIINFPEVAILGFNKIARKPVVVNVGGREEIQIRDWTLFSVSLDHRIVDGAIAAEFLKLFINIIEHPGLLLLEE